MDGQSERRRYKTLVSARRWSLFDTKYDLNTVDSVDRRREGRNVSVSVRRELETSMSGRVARSLAMAYPTLPYPVLGSMTEELNAMSAGPGPTNPSSQYELGI